MSEKLAEVYEQYDMEILSARKGRGAIILTTTDGLRILEPFRGSITRLEQEYVLKQLLSEEGCMNFDKIIPNRDGQLLTCDKYRQPFVLKCHFAGNECDMRNLEDVLRAVKTLAEFHIKGQKVVMRYADRWEQCRKEKEQKKIAEIRRAIADGEELEKISYIYELGENALELALQQVEKTIAEDTDCLRSEQNDITRMGSQDCIEGATDLRNIKRNMTKRGECSVQEDCRMRNVFERHNREIKKIQKYIAKVKKKNAFEMTFQKVAEQYLQKGIGCVDMLEQMVAGENGISMHSVWQRHYGICHGSYNHHNVILGEDTTAIVHFERFSRGNQLEDLYQFARKAMEKNHFDLVLLEDILQTYSKGIFLEKEDYYYLYILFAYPEKFWKIANNYYNSNKAFMSPKYLEKLQAVILQEQEKQEMLSRYWGFHSL